MFADLFVRGLLAHLIADWFFQNDQMATEKTDLRKWGGWLHGAMHLAASLCVFSWSVAIALTVAHILIDTRRPLQWWRRVYRQSTPEQAGAAFVPFAMWQDQAAHLLCIAAASWWVSR